VTALTKHDVGITVRGMDDHEEALRYMLPHSFHHLVGANSVFLFIQEVVPTLQNRPPFGNVGEWEGGDGSLIRGIVKGG